MKWLSPLLLLTVICCCSGCSRYVKAKVWDLKVERAARMDQPFFPELHDDSLKIQKIVNNHAANGTFGIAFSGGGTRAASAALGQMRALKELGLLEKADYVSAISGGSWAVVPFLYFGTDSFKGVVDPEKAFLGRYVPPEEINQKTLSCQGEMETEGEICNKLRFSKMISEAEVKNLANSFGREGDETYAHVLSNIFLQPYKLGCRDCFFTWDDNLKNRILADNSGVEDRHPSLVNDHILTVRNPAGPFPIIGAVLMPNKSGKYKDHIPIEFTPVYSGSRALTKYNRLTVDVRDDGDAFIREIQVPVGGGYVESIAYDSQYPDHNLDSSPAVFSLRKETNAFSLRDVLAASGAAPQATLLKIPVLRPVTANLGFPEFNYFHIQRGYDYAKHAADEGREYSHGDGGHLDNLGLMPLLARKVQKILVLVNTQTKFESPTENRNAKIYDNVTSFFNVTNNTYYSDAFERYPHNVVFSEKDFNTLIDSFEKKQKKGVPLIHCQQYHVQQNLFWDVTEPYDPNICWMYLDRSKNWIGRVGDENLGKYIGSTHSKHFPHYRTFFEEWKEGLVDVIDLSEPMVNALAGISGWSVIESEAEIRTGLGIP